MLYQLMMQCLQRYSKLDDDQFFELQFFRCCKSGGLFQFKMNLYIPLPALDPSQTNNVRLNEA